MSVRSCTKFKSLSAKDRYDLAAKAGLCKICLESKNTAGHPSKGCNKDWKCRACGKSTHNDLLCFSQGKSDKTRPRGPSGNKKPNNGPRGSGRKSFTHSSRPKETPAEDDKNVTESHHIHLKKTQAKSEVKDSSTRMFLSSCCNVSMTFSPSLDPLACARTPHTPSWT